MAIGSDAASGRSSAGELRNTLWRWRRATQALRGAARAAQAPSQGAVALQTQIQRATGDDMKLSTRNEFVGTITRLVRGPVSTEVTIRIADGVEVVSVITTNSAKRLKLKKGQRAHAFIKADHIIVGVD
jgi:molybdopterin-binding protein